jgi:hypothetical protein
MSRQSNEPGLAPARVPSMHWLAVAALALGACPNQDLAPLAPCTVSGVTDDVPVKGVDKVDLLFMIDNSQSMAEEQGKLAAQLPDLVRILTTGDKDGDGKAEFQPVSNLHLGVVTSDMGAAGVPGVPTCGRNDALGDDGILLRAAQPDTSAPNCQGFSLSGARYQTFVPSAPNSQTAQEVAADFGCLAAVGTKGCGFEQQLEAVYKALAPNNITFAKGTGGHGNEANSNFLRADAVLAVILVTDEEDCSIKDQGAELFRLNSSSEIVRLPDSDKRIGLNLRCTYKANDPNLIHPVERYIKGLKDLKPDNPDRVIFAGIVGIPDGSEGTPLADILKHPQMAFVPDPESEGRGDPAHDRTTPTPACKVVQGTKLVTSAAPAVRIVETAKGFGDNGVIRSICADSYADALDTIIDRISKQLKGACLPRPLNANEEGIVECNVVELLPFGQGRERCDPQRGRVFLREDTEANGQKRTVCQINQVAVNQDHTFRASPKALPGVPDALTGWYYDDFSDDAQKNCNAGEKQRISFRPESAKPQETTIRYECFQPVLGGDQDASGKEAVNSKCKTDAECQARNDPPEAVVQGLGYTLTCEEVSNSCQIPCQEDSQCPDGWLCELESSLCRNPTCPPAEKR